MPCWYYDQSELQSSPDDIIHQKQGVALIILISDILKIPYEVYETAAVYFHRTYISYSYSKLHRHVVSLTCLNLACKYLDANIKLEDIIKSAKTILTNIQYEALGSDILAEITLTEKLVLTALKFDLEIDHPYPYVTKMAKLVKGDLPTIEKLVYMTSTFINDSLYSTLSVQYEPEVLAVSLFYLAGRLAYFDFTEWEGMPQNTSKKWYELFVPGVNVKVIQDICHKVLVLYKKNEEDDDISNKLEDDDIDKVERHSIKMAKSSNEYSRHDRKSLTRKRFYSDSSFSSNSSSTRSIKLDKRRHHSKDRNKTHRHKHHHKSKHDNDSSTTSYKKSKHREKDDTVKTTSKSLEYSDQPGYSQIIAYRPLSEVAKCAISSFIKRRDATYQVMPQINSAYSDYQHNQPYVYPYPYEPYHHMY